MRNTAVVCDKLDVFGGAERVVEQMLAMYPRADICAADAWPRT